MIASNHHRDCIEYILYIYSSRTVPCVLCNWLAMVRAHLQVDLGHWHMHISAGTLSTGICTYQLVQIDAESKALKQEVFVSPSACKHLHSWFCTCLPSWKQQAMQ